jgi:hypothetical protein
MKTYQEKKNVSYIYSVCSVDCQAEKVSVSFREIMEQKLCLFRKALTAAAAASNGENGSDEMLQLIDSFMSVPSCANNKSSKVNIVKSVMDGNGGNGGNGSKRRPPKVKKTRPLMDRNMERKQIQQI